MSKFKKAFGANLKTLRKLNNRTQEELSEMIDVHPQQVSKIETGNYFPSSTTLEKICYALNVSPAELFNFSIDKTTDKKLGGTGTELLNKNLDELLNQIQSLEEYVKTLKKQTKY